MKCSLTIRKAIPGDINAIKNLADKNRDTLGFILRPALLESIKRRWVFVAKRHNRIVGFINYRHRQDHQTTVYEICVAADTRGQGVGTSLLDCLIKECLRKRKKFIKLKCVVGNSASNFFRHYGFKFVGTERGRKRRLKVWKFETFKRV